MEPQLHQESCHPPSPLALFGFGEARPRQTVAGDISMEEVLIVHPDGHTSADLIPGARDGSTLTHRQPGAIGGDPYGADIPAAPPPWGAPETCREHEREGGGGEGGGGERERGGRTICPRN